MAEGRHLEKIEKWLTVIYFNQWSVVNVKATIGV